MLITGCLLAGPLVIERCFCRFKAGCIRAALFDLASSYLLVVCLDSALHEVVPRDGLSGNIDGK